MNLWFFELVWFIAFNTESESENIINLLFASQVLMKSKARSTALASAVAFWFKSRRYLKGFYHI